MNARDTRFHEPIDPALIREILHLFFTDVEQFVADVVPDLQREGKIQIPQIFLTIEDTSILDPVNKNEFAKNYSLPFLLTIIKVTKQLQFAFDELDKLPSTNGTINPLAESASSATMLVWDAISNFPDEPYEPYDEVDEDSFEQPAYHPPVEPKTPTPFWRPASTPPALPTHKQNYKKITTFAQKKRSGKIAESVDSWQSYLQNSDGRSRVWVPSSATESENHIRTKDVEELWGALFSGTERCNEITRRYEWIPCEWRPLLMPIWLALKHIDVDARTLVRDAFNACWHDIQIITASEDTKAEVKSHYIGQHDLPRQDVIIIKIEGSRKQYLCHHFGGKFRLQELKATGRSQQECVNDTLKRSEELPEACRSDLVKLVSTLEKKCSKIPMKFRNRSWRELMIDVISDVIEGELDQFALEDRFEELKSAFLYPFIHQNVLLDEQDVDEPKSELHCHF